MGRGGEMGVAIKIEGTNEPTNQRTNKPTNQRTTAGALHNPNVAWLPLSSGR